MVVKIVSVCGAEEELTGLDRPVHSISKSPLCTLFFSLPQFQCFGNTRSAPVVAWVDGVCPSSLFADPYTDYEAPIVLLGPTDNRSPVLASEAVISRSTRSGGVRSDISTTRQRPSEPFSCSPSTFRSVQASSSCLETIQRFVRSSGFLQAGG